MLYDSNGIKIVSPKLEELYKNAGNRILQHEVLKEKNIENVFEEAKEILEKESASGVDCSSDKFVDKDFVNQFFDSVGDVSNEDMQHIWAKLLAGEIKQPGSFSFRTLQKLKTLSANEAKLFEKVSAFVMDFEYIPHDNEMLKKYGVLFEDLMVLQDCDIISLSSLQKEREKDALICNNSLVSVFKYAGDSLKSFKIIDNIYSLTNFGKELLSIVKTKSNDRFFYEYIGTIRNKYKGLTATFHKMKTHNGKNVEYYTNEISLI